MMRSTGSFVARVRRALVFGTAVLALTTPAHAEKKQVDSVVQRALDEGGKLPVIVRLKSGASLDGGKEVKLGEVKGQRAFGHARAFSARVDHKQLRQLLDNDDVLGVSYDAPVQGNMLGLLSPRPAGVSVVGCGYSVARSR